MNLPLTHHNLNKQKWQTIVEKIRGKKSYCREKEKKATQINIVEKKINKKKSKSLRKKREKTARTGCLCSVVHESFLMVLQRRRLPKVDIIQYDEVTFKNGQHHVESCNIVSVSGIELSMTPWFFFLSSFFFRHIIGSS